MDNNRKLAKIKKYYKHTDLLLEIYLENYHDFNIYIRLDYYKKLKSYKLSWADLANLTSEIVDSVISYEYLPDSIIKDIENVFNNIELNKYAKTTTDNFKVTYNINLLGKSNSYIFNRYIPEELKELIDITEIIFDSLPRKLISFLLELCALVDGKTNKYEYQETTTFDLFHDNLDILFDSEIINRGEKYYEEGRVFFLEKIKNSYYAVVGGKGLYVIIITYDEKKQTIKMYCSCPCEFACKHICAVIMAIRTKRFRKFYKITPKANSQELLDRIMNFNFLLTIGIDDEGNNYLVIEDGLIKLLPVLNDKGTSDWSVLEDDKNEYLTKRLNDIIK